MARSPIARSHEAAFLAPVAAGSAGLGVLAGSAPLLGAGIGALTLLSILPWIAVLAAFTLTALFNVISINVGPVNFRPEELILVAFAVRSYALTRTGQRFHWRAAEWVLVAFLGVQYLTTLLNAQSKRTSLLDATLLLLGAATYLAVFASTCTRKRLIQAGRLMLAALAFASFSGVAALVSYYALGTQWGVISYQHFGGIPTTYGLAWERDIFGSTSAAGALIFLSLWRERNPLVPRRTAMLGACVCLLALAISLTRGAWIGFGLGLVIMLLLPRRGVRGRGGIQRVALALILIAALPLAVMFISRQATNSSPVGGVIQQGGQILNFQSGSGATRAEQWRIALSEWRRAPILGFGTNSYGNRHFRFRDGVRYPAYIGNLYIRTLYDSGVVGLLVLVAFLGGVLWPRSYLLRSRGDLGPVARAFTFGWIVLAVAFVATDSMLLIWPWILLGLVRAARQQARDEYESMWRGDVAARSRPEAQPLAGSRYREVGPSPFVPGRTATGSAGNGGNGGDPWNAGPPGVTATPPDMGRPFRPTRDPFAEA